MDENYEPTPVLAESYEGEWWWNDLHSVSFDRVWEIPQWEEMTGSMLLHPEPLDWNFSSELTLIGALHLKK